MLGALRSLAVRPVPAELEMQLRVAASHQMETNQGRVDFSTATGRWWMRMQLSNARFNAALWRFRRQGGLLSSVVCFAMLAGTSQLSAAGHG